MISYFFSPHLASWKMNETTDIKVLKITVLFLVAIDDFIPPSEPGESSTLTAPALALKLFIRKNCLSPTSWPRPWQVFMSISDEQAGRGEGVFPPEWTLPSGPSFQLECLIQTCIVLGVCSPDPPVSQWHEDRMYSIPAMFGGSMAGILSRSCPEGHIASSKALGPITASPINKPAQRKLKIPSSYLLASPKGRGTNIYSTAPGQHLSVPRTPPKRSHAQSTGSFRI